MSITVTTPLASLCAACGQPLRDDGVCEVCAVPRRMTGYAVVAKNERDHMLTVRGLDEGSDARMDALIAGPWGAAIAKRHAELNGRKP